MVFAIPCLDILLTQNCNMNCKYCFEDKNSSMTVDDEEYLTYLDKGSNLSYFLFGGEPLLKLDLILESIDKLNQLQISSKVKEHIFRRLKHIITNGLLIPKYIDKIKKYNLEMQISIDGMKHIHDRDRVDKQGNGTFDRVMSSIRVCIEHDISWTLHGVCNKESLPSFAESLLFLFNIYYDYKGKGFAIGAMGQNLIQIIFEQDYDDHDIDILIDQFRIITESILKDERFTEREKKVILQKFYERTGGLCGAGTSLIAMDSKFDLYPCHRLVTVPNKEKYCLGNVNAPEEFQNYQLYNSHYRLKSRKKIQYSPITVNNGYRNMSDGLGWFMWCPATNLQTTGSIYYIPPKYALMFTEVNRYIQFLRKKYGI